MLVRVCGLKEVFRKRKSRSKWNERHSASVFVSGLRCLCRCRSRCCCGMPHVETVASLDAAQAAINQICASLSFGVQVQIVQRKESQHTAHTQRRKTGRITTWANRQNSFFFAPNFLSFLILFVQITFLLGVSPSYHAEDADDAACSVSPPLSICKIPTALIGNWPIELSSRSVPQWPINYDSDCSRLEALFMAGSVFYSSFLCFCFMFYARSINESKYNIISLTVVCASGLNFFFDWVPLA